jgi:hypothetical protein
MSEYSNRNDNARGRAGAAQTQQSDESSEARGGIENKPKDWEDRRNVAVWFRNRNKREDWHADFEGVMAVEELQDEDKCWINIKVRTDRRGEMPLSVTLKRPKR